MGKPSPLCWTLSAEAKAAAAKAAGDKEAERQWREAATPVALHDPEEVRLRLLQVA